MCKPKKSLFPCWIQSAFSDIAVLFSEFFRDLDIVPTDVLAGLMLLREEQKQRRQAIENSPQNSVFKFLSGVPVTPETKFLDFNRTVSLFRMFLYFYSCIKLRVITHFVAGATKPRISKMLNVQESQKTWRL